MDAIKRLPGLQILLSIFGFDLGLSKTWLAQNVLKIVRGIWLSLSTADSAYVTYKMVTNMPTILSGLIQIPSCWFYVIFLYWLLFKIRNLIRFSELLIPHLSEKDRKKVSKLSYCTLIFLLNPLGRLTYTLLNLDKLTTTYKFLYGFNQIHALIAHQIFIQLALSWPCIAIFMYLLFLFILLRCELNILNSIRHRVLVTRPLYISCLNSMNMILDHFDTINLLHSQFESSFSFLPLLVLSDLFLAHTKLISAAKLTSLYGIYIFLTIDSVTVLSLVYFVSHFKNELSAAIDETKRHVCRRDNLDQMSKMMIINNLNECSALKLTGWQMFDIEPSLVLSFTSALVTFTILFLGS